MNQEIVIEGITTRTFDPELVAKAMWDAQLDDAESGTFGEMLKKKIMTTEKFIALK